MDLESESTEYLTKNFMKTMPIWEHCDRFKVQIELLQYDVKNYLENLGKRTQRVVNLPFLNITNKPRILPSSTAENDMDVVRIYKKTSEGYILFDKRKNEELRRKAEHDPYRDESILMLEEKIKVDEEVYVAGNPGDPWIKCKIVSVFRKPLRETKTEPIIIFRVKTLSETPPRIIDVNKYSVARVQDHGDSLKPPKRVIAGLVRSNMKPGIIGEEPTSMNKHRYLVHMDDGSAKYYAVDKVLPILGQTPYPWQDARNVGNENWLNEAYLRYIFSTYPQRLIMKVSAGDKIELTRNGTLVPAMVKEKDRSVMVVIYKDRSEESIYRGSPRLTKRQEILTSQLRSVKDLTNFSSRLLVYMHLYSEASRRALDEDLYKFVDDFNKKILISKNHNTARKSTGKRAKSPERIKVDLDGELVEESREVVELNGNDRKHACSPDCLNIPGVKTETAIRDIIDEFRHVSDLKVPLMFGWKRKLCRVPPPTNTRNGKSKAVIVYESPCGRVFQTHHLHLIRRHLLVVGSKFDIDYFSFDRDVELNRPIGTCETYKYIENIAVDAKTGLPLENKHISLMNQFSEECLPEDFEYRNQTFPHPLLKAKNFSFNPEFKSGCDCEDDCQQRTTCSCHNLNEEFFGRVRHTRGSIEPKCQYNNKRLQEQVPTGIFECNSFCKCSSKCSNRVVQNGMRFRLQVQKTLNKGWGVITLDDIPKGAFICTYAAELLDDADQYGDSDMYYADLDYISVNEELKLNLSDSDEGVGKSDSEEARSNPPKKKKSKNSIQTVNGNEDSQDEYTRNEADDKSSGSSSSVEEANPDYFPRQTNSGQSRYPKRKHTKDKNSHNAQSKTNGRAPRFLKIHDLLKSHDFTLDARMQGNVGRFFNHSCDPNATVQNVFIETQDLRFPEVSFFAIRTIKAMGEITWNYNYKMGSIDGRRIECHCGASNCRGRIL